MNINHCISSMQTLIALAKKEGQTTWLKSSPHNLMIVDARTGATDQAQVLISSYCGTYWETLKDSDVVFNK